MSAILHRCRLCYLAGGSHCICCPSLGVGTVGVGAECTSCGQSRHVIQLRWTDFVLALYLLGESSVGLYTSALRWKDMVDKTKGVLA